MGKALNISKNIVATTNILLNNVELAYNGHTHSATGPAGTNAYRNYSASVAVAGKTLDSYIIINNGVITSKPYSMEDTTFYNKFYYDGKEIKDINLYNDDSHNFIRDFNDGIIKTDDDAIIYLYEA